jgi:hypothetical protein
MKIPPRKPRARIKINHKIRTPKIEEYDDERDFEEQEEQPKNKKRKRKK